MTNELSLPQNDKELMVLKEKSRLDDSLFSKELAPHYMQLSAKLASSELVPKSFRGKPQDLFICWAMGYQVGLTPEQSMQCIAVINGKPAMWGDDMLALCMAHKEFDDIIEDAIINSEGSVIGYNCTVKRKGKAPKSNSFTLDMAKKAGLLSKGGVWTQYPERMLKLRARGFTLRDAFPDALKGIKPREEVEDYIDVEYKVVDGSRTEFLKKDFITKREENVELTHQSADMVSSQNDLSYREETVKPEGYESLDSPGNKENQSSISNFITQEQADNIHMLIDEKGFSKERLDKAMEYYEIKSITELTVESAQHFIAQLNKA